MALPTFNPPIGPSPGTTHKPKISLYEAEFGDGYSQPTPKGINHIKRTVSLRWEALTYQQMEEIVGFFERMEGCKPFYYRPFGVGEVMKWVCKDWQASTEEGIWSVKAEFEQSFSHQI
ncbi:hypothetical protein GCM10023174_10240 [Chelativorans composti]|uniref:Phage tail protein n=1 Tax=Chelativorans composti TaxID=768533 RepID=A0ABW5DM93_9HYPH